jgi:hypothetical protein
MTRPDLLIGVKRLGALPKLIPIEQAVSGANLITHSKQNKEKRFPLIAGFEQESAWNGVS